jgi:sec-independent protein translocase protein TatB
MFSVPHLIIIFVVVLIVFGPEKLPDLARNLGKIMGEFRRATGDLRSTFDEHMRDIEREASMRAAAAGTGTTIAPTEQNTIGQPKLASPEGTVTSDGPRGWTVAPPNPSAGENAATSSSETAGATQAEAAGTNLAGGKNTAAGASDSSAAAGTGATQAEASTARADAGHESVGESAKTDHSKGSDGGSRPA